MMMSLSMKIMKRLKPDRAMMMTTLANYESISQPYFLDSDYFFHDSIVSCCHLKVKQLNLLVFDNFAELGQRGELRFQRDCRELGRSFQRAISKITFTSFVWFSCQNLQIKQKNPHPTERDNKVQLGFLVLQFKLSNPTFKQTAFTQCAARLVQEQIQTKTLLNSILQYDKRAYLHSQQTTIIYDNQPIGNKGRSQNPEFVRTSILYTVNNNHMFPPKHKNTKRQTYFFP